MDTDSLEEKPAGKIARKLTRAGKIYGNYTP